MKNEKEFYEAIREIVLDGLRQIVEKAGSVENLYELLDSSSKKKAKKTLEQEVTSIMREIGIPAHLKGYEYVREAIIMEVVHPKKSITKQVYPQIAEKFNTTPSRVERAIRYSKETAWSRDKAKCFEDIFGYSVDPEKGKPTNSEFIATIADKIRLSKK